MVASEVRNRRLDSQQESCQGDKPDISFREVCQVRACNHSDQYAAPLQQADVNHGPDFRSEQFHLYLLGIFCWPNRSAGPVKCRVGPRPACAARQSCDLNLPILRTQTAQTSWSGSYRLDTPDQRSARTRLRLPEPWQAGTELTPAPTTHPAKRAP